MTGSGSNSTVELSRDTYARVQDRVERSEFDDVSEYVEFVLTLLLAELEGESDSDGDDEEVRNRLRELGYLE